MPKDSRLRRVLRLEPGISLAQWIYDTIAALWPTVVALFVAGGGMTYLSIITGWTSALGPAGIGLIALGSALLTYLAISLAQSLRAKSRERNALAASQAQWAAVVDSVNPLDDQFHKKRLSIPDLAHPLSKTIENKKFTECHLVGPVNVAFLGNCKLLQNTFSNCDLVLIKSGAIIYNMVAFEDCTFVSSEFLNVTVYIHPGMMKFFKEMPGINFVTLTGDPFFDNQPRRDTAGRRPR